MIMLERENLSMKKREKIFPMSEDASMRKKKKIFTNPLKKKREKIFSKWKKNKKKTFSKSQDAKSCIPEEILMHEILSRLPAMVLFRFKLVCKRWHNLITRATTDLFFAAHHHHHTKTNPSNYGFVSITSKTCIISTTYDGDLHFKMSVPGPFLEIYGSVKGLLYGFLDSPGLDIFICNPITKQVVSIPNPKCHLDFALAIDDFGFVIVAVIDDEDFPSTIREHYEFEVYSSKTREWRHVPDAKLHVLTYRISEGHNTVYCKGKVYWCLMHYVMWFDVEENVAGVIPCPNQDSRLAYYHSSEYHDSPDPESVEIGVCNGGELSYSIMTREGDIEIWILKNNKGNLHEYEWVKRCNVRLQEIFEKNWNIMSEFCVKAKIRRISELVEVFTGRRSIFPLPYLDGEVVWFWMQLDDKELIGVYGKLFSINLRNQELKAFNGFNFPYPFSPSLLPCPT